MGIPIRDDIAGVWIPGWVFEMTDAYSLLAYTVIAANQGECGWEVDPAELSKILKINESHANNLILTMEETGLLSIIRRPPKGENVYLRTRTVPPEIYATQEAELRWLRHA